MKNNSTSETGLSALQVLQRNYGAMLVCPDGLASIPKHQYLVYILESDDGVIAVGHGKANRARVIFDSAESITRGHLKALFVRLHQLFAKLVTGLINRSDLVGKRLHVRRVNGHHRVEQEGQIDSLGFDRQFEGLAVAVEGPGPLFGREREVGFVGPTQQSLFERAVGIRILIQEHAA